MLRTQNKEKQFIGAAPCWQPLFGYSLMMSIFGMDSPLARGINKFLQMVYAGLLWCLCSLPIITAGASTAALFAVLFPMLKNEEGYIGRSFFRAFHENLKKGILAWLPLLFAGAVFAVNLFFYGVLGGGRFRLEGVIFAILLLGVAAVAAYAFPIIAKFENSTADTLRMAAVMAMNNPISTVALVLLTLIFLFVSWFFLYVPTLFLMGFIGYGQAAILDRIITNMLEKGLITVRKEEV